MLWAGVCSTTRPTRTSAPATASATTAFWTASATPKLAAAVYASQGDTDPVLAVSSSMDIGDNPAGQLGTAYVFSNAQQVRLYKNDVFVTALRPKRVDGAAPTRPL